MNRQLVTITEAARMLGVSTATVTRLIDRGKLPYIVGIGQRRISVRDIDAFLENARRERR